MKDHQWRVFFAIPIVTEKQEELRRSLVHSEVHLPGRAVEPSFWHITLLFIDAMERSAVRELVAKLHSKSWPENFEVTLDYLAAFPNAAKAKVVLCGVRRGEKLIQEIRSELSQAVSSMGYSANLTLFGGHVTLSRLVAPKNVEDVISKKIRPVHFNVRRFVLYRSEPELGISYYEEIASFHLAESSPD